ncbi:MAG: hypothetical protein M1549_04070 [Candidatus Dependentiae bacterium]|nr:hypothetical protein [Candidatus Dependentiae bacterium]
MQQTSLVTIFFIALAILTGSTTEAMQAIEGNNQGDIRDTVFFLFYKSEDQEFSATIPGKTSASEAQELAKLYEGNVSSTVLTGLEIPQAAYLIKGKIEREQLLIEDKVVTCLCADKQTLYSSVITKYQNVLNKKADLADTLLELLKLEEITAIQPRVILVENPRNPNPQQPNANRASRLVRYTPALCLLTGCAQHFLLGRTGYPAYELLVATVLCGFGRASLQQKWSLDNFLLGALCCLGGHLAGSYIESLFNKFSQ